MRHFGLIGHPLTHSFSKGYFADKFEKEAITDCTYENFPLKDISLLVPLIASDPLLAGLNVTIPYKEKVIPYLDETDAEAARVGAVNTIRISRQRDSWHLKGYNTDVYGFRKSIEDHIRPYCHRALILGTGGASKAVEFVLGEMGIEVLMVSRNPHGDRQITYDAVDEALLADSHIIVNCSPIGMYPETALCPRIPYQFLTGLHILYDLIYNPEETLFLMKGRQRGAKTINGLQMLYLQAEKSWNIWNG